MADADYQGLVRVLLFNDSNADFAMPPEDRIAQMVVERVVASEVPVYV
jgi:dUTPase